MLAYLFITYNIFMKLSKKRYLAAVSGGPDSMALLHKYQNKIIAVCHVNYHKRVDSDYDTSIVKAYCAKHNIKLLIYDVKKSEYSKSSIHNFQTLARKIRYDFFVKCGKKLRCNDLLIAHNLNDFLETALMQEARHSQNFFYGVKPISHYQTLTIYRPLIDKFKDDLEKYCKLHKLAYAIDSSNASDIYERNRVRKQLAKKSKAQLLKMHLQICNRNKKFAKVEKQVNKYLLEWSGKKYEVKYFKSLNPKFMDSLVYLYLKKINISNVNYNKVKLVRDFIVSNKSNISLRLEDGIKLVKKDKKVKVCLKK